MDFIVQMFQRPEQAKTGFLHKLNEKPAARDNNLSNSLCACASLVMYVTVPPAKMGTTDRMISDYSPSFSAIGFAQARKRVQLSPTKVP
eukprot:1702563-Amphidinium_carterae.1